MRTILLLALAALVACSAPSEEPGSNVDRDLSDVSGRRPEVDSGTTTADPDVAAAVDAEDAAAPEDTGAAPSDVRRPEAGPPDVPDFVEDECAQVTAVGDPIYALVDVVWVIDTSGSMTQEMVLVQEKLNEFVDFIEDSGLDVRVVLIADASMCVPAPLSGGGCPDTNSERYRHVVQTIGSTNAFSRIVGTYDLYSDFLRHESVKHFVVVSDDESDREARWFWDEMTGRGLLSFVFHAIVSLEETDCFLGQCDGCSGPYGDAVSLGDRYIVATEMTDGTANSICEPDWTPTFNGIAENVIAGAALPCQYAIPDIGDGLDIVYSRVDVTINGVRLTRHEGPTGCESAPGWFYDDPEAPTQVILCPGFCGFGFEGDEVEIQFGCVKG